MRGESPLLPAYNHPVETEVEYTANMRGMGALEYEDAMAEIPLEAAERTSFL